MASEEEVAQLKNLQSLRRFVVIAAVVVFVLAYATKNPIFSTPRAALWGVAGLLSVIEGVRMKRVGYSPSNALMNAAIYLAVALVPLLRGR